MTRNIRQTTVSAAKSTKRTIPRRVNVSAHLNWRQIQSSNLPKYRGIARIDAPIPASNARSESQGCVTTCLRWNHRRSTSVLMPIHSRCSACPIMRSPNGNSHYTRSFEVQRLLRNLHVANHSLPVPARVMNAVIQSLPPKQILQGNG